MPETWKILGAKVPCLLRIFESENKELDIYEVWTPIHDEKSIKLPVWKEVGVTQSLGLSLSLLLCPPFTLILPNVTFFTSLAAPFLYVVCCMWASFSSWERWQSLILYIYKTYMWFLFKAAGILCLFTNILISSLTFCAASMLGRYKLYLCKSGRGLCSFGDRWLWCATKPNLVQKSNQLFTFYLCSQSIVVKSARVGVCWRGRGSVLQLYIVYSIVW